MAGNLYRRNFLVGAGALGVMAGAPLMAAQGPAKAPKGGGGVYNVREFGAAGDGKRYDTCAMVAAIDACAGKGGGTVLFPAGRYLTGAIRLQSNVNLHLDPGATILGSQDASDYPVYSSPWQDGAREISSLIYGEDLENVSLTGRGTVDGQGRAWWIRQWLRSPKKHVQVPLLSESERREEVEKIRFGRPHLVHLVWCRNVLIQGLTFMNSPAWTLHPTFCEYMIIDGVTILNPVPSPNTDGIDPESCRNLHISNTHIDVGDDCIAIKSGKDEAGRRMGKPCENITITNLTTAHGHGGVSIGSEMSGGVRNVAISNCIFQGTDRGIRIKTQRGRGGVVERVAASNITMQDVPEPFGITMFYSRGNVDSEQPVTDATPRFRDFQFDNIVATGARFAEQITGLVEMPVSNVTMSNVRLDSLRGFSCQNAREIAFRDVRIQTAEGSALKARVETYADAQRCADLFHAHSDRIDGVLVTLPNFGDERGVADALRLSRLGVPVLVHAYPDDLQAFQVERRRDAFCGKLSICNNLRQYGIPFSLTQNHVVHPRDDGFQAELERFLGVCRVVKGFRNIRIGAIGARPTAFNTVRYSEKILESAGISVITVDLSDVFGETQKLADNDSRVKARLEEIYAYADTSSVPPPSLVLMGKLAVVISDWMEANSLNATAIQCWTSIQNHYGVNACTIMSIMSDKMMPSACEVDVTGVVSMYALQLASNTPSALVDWNNNYGGHLNKCVFFHCGNWAKSFVPEVKVSTAPILGTIVGEKNTYGALEGRTPAGSVTFGRVSTDDVSGKLRTYVGEGRFTDDQLKTFGTRAVVEVPKLQKLMRFVCREGFEHHAAMNKSHTAGVLAEAFGTYLGWDVYYHEQPEE